MKPKARQRPSGFERKVRGRKKSTSSVDDNCLQVTESMRDAFLHFLEYHPPSRVSCHLRRMLVEWVITNGAREGWILRILCMMGRGLKLFLPH